MVRSYGEIGNIPVLSRELTKVVDYLVLNRDKCLKNFSKNFPNSPAFFRDLAAFKQGTYTDYVNGLKNVLVDVDGKVYPSTSHAGRGLAMGSIYGDVNQSMYDQFSTARDDCDCYLKKMCVPNYEHFNPEGKALPFKGTSHCDYFQAIYDAMYAYYRRIEGKSV
jgi:sulfatase maturation enzyme AslB (radical SAM superfamily)